MAKAKRKRPSAAVRSVVAHRQDYKCSDCRSKLPVAWHVDHVVPLSDARWSSYTCDRAATAAANDISNLQALCANCHCKKSLFEASEPALLRPARPARPPATLSWEAARLRNRSIIDTIWAKSAAGDRLTQLLLEPSRWKQLAEATTDKELRKIYRDVRKHRMIDFKSFKIRVDHLLAS